MPISIVCSECEKKLKAPDTAAGKKIRCPSCKAVIAVPMPETPADSDDLVEPDEETAVTKSPAPKKKSESIKDGPPPRKRVYDDDEEDSRDFDDEDDDEDEPRPKKKKKKRLRGEPHRGTTILVLGILSIPGCICPLLAWILGGIAANMANTDLAKMDSGRMNSSGRGMTQTGKICGIVGVIFGVINAIAGIVIKVMG